MSSKVLSKRNMVLLDIYMTVKAQPLALLSGTKFERLCELTPKVRGFNLRVCGLSPRVSRLSS